MSTEPTRQHEMSHHHGSGHCDQGGQSPEQVLLIEGAGCASCVGKIETALRNVAGVASAEMNFAQRQVTVTGTAGSNTLIAAVEKAGYGAKLQEAESESDALAEKEQTDSLYYTRQMPDMRLALSL